MRSPLQGGRTGETYMEYAVFKPLFGLLMFGAALVFGFSQLAAVRPERRALSERADQDRSGRS